METEEIKKYREKYEKDRKYREEHEDLFPWFGYFQFGFHNMNYYSEEEVQEMVKFYHLKKIGDRYERYGRQPITIMPRK